ncbi:MAG: hypothetical protein ACREMB_10455 [Candidatus Rokuibacteriota bacterium]
MAQEKKAGKVKRTVIVDIPYAMEIEVDADSEVQGYYAAGLVGLRKMGLIRAGMTPSGLTPTMAGTQADSAGTSSVSDSSETGE